METSATIRRVLLTEDDADLAGEIVLALQSNAFDVTVVDLADLPAALRAEPVSLIVMDRMVAGTDSLTILPALRAASATVPLILISFLGSVDEKIRGLRAGGDDYLIKPFAMDELLARAEALVRRSRADRQTSLAVGDLALDLIDRSVRRGARAISLLPREFQLLEYLMRHADQVVSRAMLLEDIWHYKSTIQTNVIDAHIANLRRKINGDGEANLIRNVRGAGFVLTQNS